MRFQIAVVGGSDATAESVRLAEDVGAAIARAGAVLVCGGLGGIMEAAAKGAREGGGLTVGILPGRSRADQNPYIDCAVATGLGHLRNFLVVQTADAVIALPGRSGTLSEIAMALTLGKPVIDLGSWGVEGMVPATGPLEAVALCRARL